MDGHDAGAQLAHAEHVELLSADVLIAHVDVAFESEDGGGGGGGHPVLARARLGDHPGLAHAHGEQAVAQGAVDLVGAGVAEVLSLDEHAGAAPLGGQAFGEVQGRRAPRILGEHFLQAPGEGGVRLGPLVLLLQLRQRVHERFGHVASAVGPEPTPIVGDVRTGVIVRSHGRFLQEISDEL